METTIAFRVKGYGGVIEGRLIDDPDMVLIVDKYGVVRGGPIDVIEAVWFLCKWMNPEEFQSMQ